MGLLSSVGSWPVDHVAAAALMPDGTVVHEGPVDRPFALASVTKPLVAMAILVASEDGTLDLDEPAGPPGSTVAHVLSHASGLGPERDDVVTGPGIRRIYSNWGYEVIGTLLADRSGLSVGQWVHEAVARPLGMTATVVDGSPAHGGTGSAADLLRLATDLLAPDPQTMAPATRDRAVAPAFPSLGGVLPGFGQQDPNPWGLGVEIRGAKSPHWTPDDASPDTFGHFGRSGTFFWCDPVRHCALVALTDREFGPWAPPVWRALGTDLLARA